MKFVRNNLVGFIIIGVFCLIGVFVTGYSNNFYRDTLKTKVLQVGEVQVYYGDGFKNLKDVSTTGMEDITYYCDVTVNYNGDEITFKEGRQTIRELPSVGEEITVYKDKKGNINSYTSKDRIIMNIILFVGIICELLAVLSVIRKNNN